MLQKIKTIDYKYYAKLLRDVRVLGLMLFGVVVLLVSWSGVKVIQSNYELQKKIARLEQENEVQQLENDNLKLRNQYLETDQFLELAARRQFGKGAPGERLIIVPKEVALSRTVDLSEPEAETAQVEQGKSTYQKNFESWMNFFLGRPKIVEE